MVDRLLALSGPHAALAWVALASAAIGLASVLVQAAVKAPVRTGGSLAFRTAFVVVFCRIAYRTINGGQVTYGAVIVYALPGLACLWVMADSLVSARRHRS